MEKIYENIVSDEKFQEEVNDLIYKSSFQNYNTKEEMIKFLIYDKKKLEYILLECDKIINKQEEEINFLKNKLKEKGASNEIIDDNEKINEDFLSEVLEEKNF